MLECDQKSPTLDVLFRPCEAMGLRASEVVAEADLTAESYYQADRAIDSREGEALSSLASLPVEMPRLSFRWTISSSM